MALFKISKGLKTSLPTTKTDGYCWYTTDDSLFYIDYKDENGTLQRKALNAKDAETLTGASLSTILSSSDIEIPTSKAVFDAIEAANVVYVGPTEPTDPNIKVWINTAEEGTGVVPVLPRVSTITLSSSAWTGSASPYSQAVSIATVTSATKIELNPTVAQIVSLQNDDIALMAENDGGSVKIYSFGGKPSTDMTMQVTLTEVSYI